MNLYFFLLFVPYQIGLDVENIYCISAEAYELSNECPDYGVKPSDSETPALEIWGIRSTPSLPLLPGPLWLGVVASDRVLSMGQIEQTVQTNDWG